jgi:diguanylate cyclase (GGDEF)-like protein
MQRLVRAVQELSMARDLESVQRIVRSTARELTGCDGATFVLRENGKCHYVDEDAIAPLWKGKRFPLESCISGWSMLNRKPATVADIYRDPRIPADAYRPTFVKSLVMVPIRALDPVGAIGNYWAKEHRASEAEVALLQALADSTSVAMENVALYGELEQRVKDRTAALQKAHDEIQKLYLSDDLTLLNNRRGFMLLASQALLYAGRRNKHAVLVFIDIDGLKFVNDTYGHDAGDAMIVEAAKILRKTFRQSDVIARIGGDEFCALALDADDARAVQHRIDRGFARYNASAKPAHPLAASVGIVEVPPTLGYTLEELLVRADRAMYAEKKSRGRARPSCIPEPPSEPSA